MAMQWQDGKEIEQQQQQRRPGLLSMLLPHLLSTRLAAATRGQCLSLTLLPHLSVCVCCLSFPLANPFPLLLLLLLQQLTYTQDARHTNILFSPSSLSLPVCLMFAFLSIHTHRLVDTHTFRLVFSFFFFSLPPLPFFLPHLAADAQKLLTAAACLATCHLYSIRCSGQIDMGSQVPGGVQLRGDAVQTTFMYLCTHCERKLASSLCDWNLDAAVRGLNERRKKRERERMRRQTPHRLIIVGISSHLISFLLSLTH